VENTAPSGYWQRFMGEKPYPPALCSECDPKIGKWHGMFEKKSAVGMVQGSDGFLYHKDYEQTENFKWRHEHQGLKIEKVIEE
jgi:hypothetical protein